MRLTAGVGTFSLSLYHAAMTFLAVSMAVRGPDNLSALLEQAARAIEQGARMIEWRVDELASADQAGAINHISRLLADSPAPCILTCRPTWEGGRYERDESARLELFIRCCALPVPPQYLDIELRQWRDSESFRHGITEAIGADAGTGSGTDSVSNQRTRLILSTHDFNGRPADLLRRVEQMTIEPLCSVMKIAWTARSLRDNLQAFDLLAERHKPAIVLCMGRFGLPSRVLAPKFKSFLTFASIDESHATAPGQPAIHELTRRYRFNDISPATGVYGVIGWPVEHSRGPDIHNAGFQRIGHDGVYLPLPVPPEYEHFKATIGAFVEHKTLNFCGASVTVPHKTNLLRFVEELGGRVDDMTRRIGAANTLTVNHDTGDPQVECTNTDAPAVVDAIAAGLKITTESLRRRIADLRVAVLGAGGMARAAVAALADLGANVTIFNRTSDRALALAGEFAGLNGSVAAGENQTLGKEIESRSFDVLINTTSIGMMGGPAPEQSPLTAITGREIEITESMTVFDTVYTPVRTQLIADAERSGARIITGVELFIRQAVRQFEMWTDRSAPLDVFSAKAHGR